MPREFYDCGTCVLGSDIYVIGMVCMDYNEMLTATTYRYDTTTNVWATLAPMPLAKEAHSVCIMSGLIYVLGGRHYTGEDHVLSSCHRYDPVANAWSALAFMSTPRAGCASFVLGGSLYVAGGFDGDNLISNVECYNVPLDRWETVDNMALSVARVGFRAHAMQLEVGLFDSLEAKARHARIQMIADNLGI